MKNNLGFFVAEMQEDLKRFRAYWLRMHNIEPDHFPLELDPGEWDEQFRVWQDATDEEG